MWYVVQTMKGQEYRTLGDIRQYITGDDEEAFIMENEKMFRHRGKWEPDRENLFAGYLFIDTERPEDFDKRLHGKYRTLKLLRVDDEITAIRPEEEEFLKKLGGEEHVVRYSEGFKDGDEIVIESGALKGLNGVIEKLDRHNRQARITLSLFGRETTVTLGLGIVRSV